MAYVFVVNSYSSRPLSGQNSLTPILLLLLSVLALIGALLLSVGYGLRNKSIRESRLVPNPAGYGYTNPNAMNLTTPVESGCLVVQPYLNCTYSGRLTNIFCYAQVSYLLLNGTNTTRLTATTFTTTSSYFNYHMNQNVSCFTDIHRPDLVSYFPYLYPTPNLRKGLIISGYVIIALGLIAVILFILSLIRYYFEKKEERQKKEADDVRKANESDKNKEPENSNETTELERA
jgi:preprotein translocase subunit SecG